MKIDQMQDIQSNAYKDWEQYLANPRFIRKRNVITWIDRRLYTDDPTNLEYIYKLSEEKQYSFQIVEDGSIIQMYYQYDDKGRVIKLAHLSYYGIFKDTIIDSYLTEGDDAELDVSYEDKFISWLRIDYQPEHAGGVLHSHCHLHISSFPNSRMIVRGIPTPKQFLEFIMSLCYPSAYSQHRLDRHGDYIDKTKIISLNHPSIFNIIQEEDHFHYLTHINLPHLYKKKAE